VHPPALAPDPNAAENQYGDTSQLFASTRGDKAIVELLVANNADVNARDSKGGTPLHLAANAGHKAVVEVLLNYGAEYNASD